MIGQLLFNHRRKIAATNDSRAVDAANVTHDAESPYIAARREWNERYGDYLAQARNWRLAAILALSISAILAGGEIWLAGQSKLIPYVVEVDKLGSALAVARADQASFTPDQPLIRSQLASWISDARSVSSDAGAERTTLTRVYSLIATTAKPYLDAWYQKHSPFEEGRRQAVSVTVDAVLPQSGTTYQVQWTEEQRDLNGSHGADTHWIADVTVGSNPPTDEATMLHNPLGLYITQLTWTQRI